MKTDSKFSYHIDPRNDEVGGGYQLKLLEYGQEVGGGVFPVTSDTTTDEAYLQASDAAEEWLQSRKLDRSVAGANYGDPLDDAMIDIETLGKKPGAAVLSVGAVMFGAGGLGQSFYSPVLLQSCTDVGLTIDPETIAWWMKQSDEARAAAFVADAPRLPLVLQRFTDWFVAQQARYPWCHGATFDVPILDAAYEACGMPAPWKLYDVRDTRTLYDLAGVKVDRSKGTHHNALDDARAQAKAAVVALQRLRGPHDDVVFINHGDQPEDTSRLNCLACNGSGHVDDQSPATRDVLAERRRHIEAEGWDPEDDDQYVAGELANAAACYASEGVRRHNIPGDSPLGWPWPGQYWKPSDYRRNLEKAGALILAEIERIDRAAAGAGAKHD